MCQIDYTKSLQKISHKARQGLFKARLGKKPDRCFTHFDSETGNLYVGTPYSLPVNDQGNAVNKIKRMCPDSVKMMVPVSMPRAVA